MSKRIAAIIDQVDCRCLADIACDHGYIAIGAVTAGRSIRAIACDINKEPLSKAVANIRNAGLTDKIETRLGSGFSVIRQGEADEAVVAGIGGLLLMEILHAHMETVKTIRKLILLPQSEVGETRYFLHKNGFEILDESMVYEDGKFYNLIIAAPTDKEIYLYKEWGYTFGYELVKKKNPLLKQYLKKEIERYTGILNSIRLTDKNTKRAETAGDEIKTKLDSLKEVMDWL